MEGAGVTGTEGVIPQEAGGPATLPRHPGPPGGEAGGGEGGPSAPIPHPGEGGGTAGGTAGGGVQADGSGRPRFLPAAEIDAHIRRLVEAVPGGIEGKIVRLVIEDIPRELFRQLDHRQLRTYRAEALHFHLDARRPEVRRVVGYGAPFRRRTLDEEVETFLKLRWRPSSREIDVTRLIDLARMYLAAAGQEEPRDALVEARAEG